MVNPDPKGLVVLDRDGVINRESRDFIRTVDDWVPLPGSIEAIGNLTRAGFTIVVATNQSGVGRGLIRPVDLNAIHARMTAAIEAAGGRLDGIYFCPHLPEAGCECRKPRPGLLRQIEASYGISLRNRPAIGDSYRDLEAAWSVGARAILVRTGNGAETERVLRPGDAVEVVADLAAAAALLVAESQR